MIPPRNELTHGERAIAAEKHAFFPLTRQRFSCLIDLCPEAVYPCNGACDALKALFACVTEPFSQPLSDPADLAGNIQPTIQVSAIDRSALKDSDTQGHSR